MPIYRVEWPTMSNGDREVSLVKARNTDELVDILDQVGDPGAAKVSQFRDDFFLSFKIPKGYGYDEEGYPLDDELEIEPKIEGCDANEDLMLSLEGSAKTTIELGCEIKRYILDITLPEIEGEQ